MRLQKLLRATRAFGADHVRVEQSQSFIGLFALERPPFVNIIDNRVVCIVPQVETADLVHILDRVDVLEFDPANFRHSQLPLSITIF